MINTNLGALQTRAIAVLIPFLLASPAAAAADPTYAALRAARPTGPSFALRAATLKRGTLVVHLESGTLQLLAPVEGRSPGAVFVGHGSWTIEPLTASERRHIELQTGQAWPDRFADQFERLVVLFSDDTEAEIRKLGTPAPADPQAGPSFDEFLNHERKDWRTNFHLRCLQGARDDSPGPGHFTAFVDGAKLPRAVLAFDPTGVENVGLSSARLGGAEAGVWLNDQRTGGLLYLGHVEGEPAHAARDNWIADRYAIDTTILPGGGVRGVTEMNLHAQRGGLRFVPLTLFPNLRIRGVEALVGDAWKDVAFVQEAATEDFDAAAVLPAPVPERGTATLRVTYEGNDVLTKAGDGNFVVEARQSWYPNVGSFGTPADFALTFRHPKGFSVVSMGSAQSEALDGSNQVVKFKGRGRVAGFNYGKFKRIERADADSGLALQVYTTPGEPDIIKEINGVLDSRSGAIGVEDSIAIGDLSDPEGPAPRVAQGAVHVDASRLAEAAMADGINSARLCSTYFGKLPPGSVAITQQSQWSFGQSWPGLIFMPYLAFLDGTQRESLGLGGLGDFVDSVGLHEFAHQWFGHRVGWATYEDQWLSEGLAEYAASLVLQHTKGMAAYARYWKRSRDKILEKPTGAEVANSEAGPISMGYRLATGRSPGAYGAIVYAKGAFVAHMLRMTMRDPRSPNPDAAFIEAMKDFVATYADRNPGTRDFQHVFEKHMTPALNATGDGKLDWFFDQWVYGVEVPKYRAEIRAQKTTGDQYTLTGTLAQEGVSPSFLALVPLYADFGGGKLSRVGVVPMKGSSTIPINTTLRLPKKPEKILVNALYEVLARP